MEAAFLARAYPRAWRRFMQDVRRRDFLVTLICSEWLHLTVAVRSEDLVSVEPLQHLRIWLDGYHGNSYTPSTRDVLAFKELGLGFPFLEEMGFLFTKSSHSVL